MYIVFYILRLRWWWWYHTCEAWEFCQSWGLYHDGSWTNSGLQD